ncbi:futalosine hydrolase, partial [Streptomyces sp. SID8014]|nr:futalosine hydrolase [Streptomyces sp. SID8014]
MRLLVATAVPPERDAVARAFGASGTPEETALPGVVLLRTPGADVLAAGVGPAAAASATSAALT